MSTLLFILSIIALITFIFIFITFKLVQRVSDLNKQYEKFAYDHGYYFLKAQGNDGYRQHSFSKTKPIINLNLVKNPYVEKFANFSSYPFGRGAEKKVAYVISGIYREVGFTAFTYEFSGSSFENSGAGGIFSIIMIDIDAPKAPLPKNVFYEKGQLCEYVKGNLDVNTIHKRIEQLIKLKENRHECD